MKKNKRAFTLAEILIALTVIGVISAVTVPVLMHNTQKQEYVTALKKAYSTLSQAANQVIAEEGAIDKWEDTSAENIYNLFKEHLINVKECSSETGCVPQGSYRYLNGRKWIDFENDVNKMRMKNRRILITADGMQYIFEGKEIAGSGCGSGGICGIIYVDINGAKTPNTAGRDLFRFNLSKSGLQPYGCDNSDDCISKTGVKSYGQACTCKVLREGAMNY